MSRFSTKSLAGASARRPWRIIALWAVTVAVAVAAQSLWLGEAFTQEFRYSNAPDSQIGQDLLVERLTGPALRNEIVIVRSGEHTVDDPAFEERVDSLAESIRELGPPSITPALTYYNGPGGDLFVSPDRRATLI